MKNFTTIETIISYHDDDFIKTEISPLIQNFFEELDLFCERNVAHDFGEWFTERSFLSMFFNGNVRKDSTRRITIAQEYFVVNVGRCDALMTLDGNLILIESKMQRYCEPVDEGHFREIEKWINWDETTIRKQLTQYYHAESKYYNNKEKYESCYLMTMVFKNVKENTLKHCEQAKKWLSPFHRNNLNRIWYYSVGFLNDNNQFESVGIEVYGTIEKMETFL